MWDALTTDDCRYDTQRCGVSQGCYWSCLLKARGQTTRDERGRWDEGGMRREEVVRKETNAIHISYQLQCSLSNDIEPFNIQWLTDHSLLELVQTDDIVKMKLLVIIYIGPKCFPHCWQLSRRLISHHNFDKKSPLRRSRPRPSHHLSSLIYLLLVFSFVSVISCLILKSSIASIPISIILLSLSLLGGRSESTVGGSSSGWLRWLG